MVERKPFSWGFEVAQAKKGPAGKKKPGGQPGPKPVTQERRDIAAALLLLAAIEGLTRKELERRLGVGKNVPNDWVAGRVMISEENRVKCRAAFSGVFHGFEGTVDWIREQREKQK